MKFQKTIDISEAEIIQEINETFNNDKRKDLIMKILPEDDYQNLDLEFLMKIMKLLSDKVIIETNGTGLESEAKEINMKIKNLHKELIDAGWIY